MDLCVKHYKRHSTMKHTFFALLMVVTQLASAQVGIGTNNPEPSAILDLSASDKGLLIPRLTQAEVATIDTPVSGLLIYNATFARFEYYDGFAWKTLKIDDGYAGIISNMDGDVSVSTVQNLAEKKITMHSAGKQVVSIDTTSTRVVPPMILGDDLYQSAQARLDVDGRLKISDDDLSTPESGMIRWNDTKSDFEGFDGTMWQSLTSKGSASDFGKSVTFGHPDEVVYYSASTKYNGSNLARRENRSIYTYFDPSLGKTKLLIQDDGVTIQEIVVDETQAYAYSERLYFNYDWIFYKTNNNIKTWQLVNGAYVEKADISNHSRVSLLEGNRAVVLVDDVYFTFIDLLEFDANINSWTTIRSTQLLEPGCTSVSYKDQITFYNWRNTRIWTYNLSNGYFTQIDQEDLSNSLYSYTMDSLYVITAEEVPNTNNFKLQVRLRTDLGTVVSEQVIDLPYMEEQPKIRLALQDNVLVVGISNTRSSQGIKSGRTLVYDFEQSQIMFSTELLPLIQQEDMRFGQVIFIEDDGIKVSAPYLDARGTEDLGSIYKFFKQ